MLIWLVVWALSILATRMLTGYKGQDHAINIVLVFLLGPLATIYALLLPRDDDAWPRCPHCGSRVPAGYSVCSHCGRELAGK